MSRDGLLILAAVAAGLAIAPPASRPPEEDAMKTTATAEAPLPEPRLRGTMSLEEALAKRRSVRAFESAALARGQVAQLLWAAQGRTHERGLRTAPSAGALYPLELYVALPDGLHHYDPARHRLERRIGRDVRPALHRAALEQESVRDAPAVFVFSAVEARTRAKYRDRTERYVALEVGHAAQNLLLEATALGLAGVPVGAFQDDRVHRALGLPGEERVLYLLPVGVPR
jgi:SagB-type dehydrogenase family enzyme